MSLLLLVLVCTVFLLAAYLSYGRLLGRFFRLDAAARTPAVEFRDDVDYVPIRPRFLMGQHFSAIAAAGPIVGPITAAVMFGWGPALLWVLLGSVLIGGVHDLGALVASMRHRARSITEVVREYMSRRSYMLFLAFVWISLVYVIVVFTDIVAGSFVGSQKLDNEIVVSGGATASSSLIYLALPVIMGLLMRYAKLPLLWATVIFLPLVGLGIWAGPHIPLDLSSLFGSPDNPVAMAMARKVWDVLLLLYCFTASLVPMWLLLQPRGHLGGYFLYITLVGGMLGILFGGAHTDFPAFTGWTWTSPKGDANPLFPVLFVTVACGACSGFHAIVASGTTSKQLRLETDARAVGYGAMLLEGLVAVVSLCCVMMFTRESAANLTPNMIYAKGIGGFLEVVGVPAVFAISFALLAFTTFVYDTLDVCTRLGRYVLQELSGERVRGRLGGWVATALTAGTPLFFVMMQATDGANKPIPAWKVFWNLFGASNQLLAALTLLAVTVWLTRTGRRWAWAVTGLPAAFMYVMSSWALLRFMREGFFTTDWSPKLPADAVAWAALVLAGLAAVLLIEAVRTFARPRALETSAERPAE